MNIEQAIDILHALVAQALLVVAPILLAAVVIGVVVSLLQSVTSVQEQTLTFVPKLVGIGLVLVFAAPWMLRNLMQFTITFITRIPDMVR
jgi:flagellar biosynthesis protein FliQ